MKGIFLTFAVFFTIFVSMGTAHAADISNADFDSDFSNAAQVRGSEAVKGTDILVRDTTSALHNEHMAILAELAKLEAEIANIKKDVKDTKDQVEGGQ